MVNFVPVRVFSTHADSPVRAMALSRAQTGIVVLRDDKLGANGEVLFRPEMWLYLESALVHMTTEGTGAIHR